MKLEMTNPDKSEMFEVNQIVNSLWIEHRKVAEKHIHTDISQVALRWTWIMIGLWMMNWKVVERGKTTIESIKLLQCLGQGQE